MTDTVERPAVEQPRVDDAVADRPDVWLEVPEHDAVAPQVSIVIPAMNEEITISGFVAWCHEGLRAADVVGEILIVDSSTDATPRLAVEAGARVLHVPKRGLGRAYIDALPHVRGEWIVMGDADCTYDFRQLAPFIERFREGHEYVMGSRWKGSIEQGAMPPHHQYFGTPVTTWILNRLYASRFTDIHCGMRGITKAALERMQLQSQSWEYASEMVLKSVHMRLRTAEVPVHFLKDQEGRVSHHRREGWFSPFKAAWINLRAMFVYGSDFFVFKPGLLLAYLGLLMMLPLTFGSFKAGPVELSTYWHLAFGAMFVFGLVAILASAVSMVLFDYTGAQRRRWLSTLRYTRTSGVAALMVLAGLGLIAPLIAVYIDHDLELPAATSRETHMAITGGSLVFGAFVLFVFTLLVHAAALASRYAPPEATS